MQLTTFGYSGQQILQCKSARFIGKKNNRGLPQNVHEKWAHENCQYDDANHNIWVKWFQFTQCWNEMKLNLNFQGLVFSSNSLQITTQRGSSEYLLQKFGWP